MRIEPVTIDLRRGALILCLLMLPALACSIGGSAGTSAPPTLGPTDLPAGGEPPKVTVESPADGSQAVVQQSFTVQVHATDPYGVTRIEMHEGGRIVVSQPLPAPDTDAQALLMFRPTSVGPVTLEVVAYRNRLSSPPVTISVDVVGSVADLKNPNSLNPTSGIAAGPICAIKTLVSNLNLRGGPGTNYTSLARLSVAEDLTVIGRNDDSTWFQVKRDSNNMVGWVSASFTTPNDGCASAPVVTPPAAGT